MILRMAWRNVWRNPRRTAVVVAAVSIGLAGVLFCVALFYGMALQMVDTAISTDLGHVQIHASGYDTDPELRVRLQDGGRAAGAVLDGRPEVRAWTRRVRGEGLVTSTRASAGVRVIGVDPASEATVSVVGRSLTAGSYLTEPRRAVIGARLAKTLDVEVGDKIVLSVTDMNGDLTGEALRVGGLFHTSSTALNGGAIFLRLDESQALLGLGDAVSEIAVVAEHRDDVSSLRDALVAALPALEVKSWGELQPILVYMVEIFDQMGAIMYVAVFIAMAFGIANVLLMTVYERVREIGILMAIGMNRRRVATEIVVESLLLAFVGVVIGYAMGLAATESMSEGLDLGYWAEGLEAYGIGARIIPVVRSTDFVVPTSVALLTAVLASAWPALRATRLRPADAVRHV